MKITVMAKFKSWSSILEVYLILNEKYKVSYLLTLPTGAT
jgi:hypothetical protein